MLDSDQNKYTINKTYNNLTQYYFYWIQNSTIFFNLYLLI